MEENTKERRVETEDKMEVEEDKKKNDEVHYQPNKYPSNTPFVTVMIVVQEDPYFPLHNVDIYIKCSLCSKVAD